MIEASELKARCLAILDEVGRTGESVVISKHGRPVAEPLPDDFHRDPVDRIIVATARVHDATLLTRDKRIIDAKLVTTIR